MAAMRENLVLYECFNQDGSTAIRITVCCAPNVSVQGHLLGRPRSTRYSAGLLVGIWIGTTGQSFHKRSSE